MRAVQIAAPVAALVVLAGCAGQPQATSSAPTPTSTIAQTAAPTGNSAGIPTGSVWKKTLTEADRKTFGVLASTKEMQWAPDHTLTVVYKFGDGTWTQFGNYDGGPLTPGEGGTLSYVADNELELTSTAAKVTYRFRYDIDGNTLTLTMLGNPTEDPDISIVRMMFEGTYTREQQ